MSTTNGNALGHYRSVGAYGAAAAGDRLQLVLRMMEGARDRIVAARGHMQRGETGLKAESITRAIGLIDGLRASLDHEQGGDVAGNLEALYEYMARRLIDANLQNDEQMLDEVSALMGEIVSAWSQVAATPPSRPAADAAKEGPVA